MCELTAETFECEICNVAFSLQSHIQTFDSFKSETDVGEFLTEVIVTMPLVNLLSSYVRCVMWHLCCVPFHSYFQVGSSGGSDGGPGGATAPPWRLLAPPLAPPAATWHAL